MGSHAHRSLCRRSGYPQVSEGLALRRAHVGRPARNAVLKPLRWAPSALAVTEAMLYGRRITGGTMQEATELPAGSAANTPRTLSPVSVSCTPRRVAGATPRAGFMTRTGF